MNSNFAWALLLIIPFSGLTFVYSQKLFGFLELVLLGTFGVIIAVVGLVNKRWLNILSLILGLIIAAAAFYYQKQFIEIKFVGIGIWTLLLAGLLSIAGSVNGLRKK